MQTFDIYRILIVLIPAMYLAVAFLSHRHTVREWAGSVLAYAWQLQFRLLLLAAGFALGLLELHPAGHVIRPPLFYQVPVDIVIGTSLLFGAVFGLRFGRIAPFWFALADAGLNGLCLPLSWSPGVVCYYGLVSAVCVIPSLYLARWTAQDTHLYLRALLQPTIWIVVLLWLIPSMLFSSTGTDWTILWSRPWWMTGLLSIPLILPAVILANALFEFAVRGRGTAFPYDPPRNLVTTGVYRYVSNPMQIGIVLLMLSWGVVLDSPYVMGTGGVAIMLFIAFRDVCNGSCRIGATDPHWQIYQRTVRRWWPRFKTE